MGKRKSFKQRKDLHLKNFDYKNSNFVYFITLCTANKQPYFSKKAVAKIIIKEIDFRNATTKEIKIYCLCLMPDHLHILLSLSESYNKTLQNWVTTFKRHTAKDANELFCIKPLWQKNFYDHVVRQDESLLKIIEYIVQNPVRKGMVSDWEEYPYSRIMDPLPL
jgi:REP element-mobilizing transposase RayT